MRRKVRADDPKATGFCLFLHLLPDALQQEIYDLLAVLNRSDFGPNTGLLFLSFLDGLVQTFHFSHRNEGKWIKGRFSRLSVNHNGASQEESAGAFLDRRCTINFPRKQPKILHGIVHGIPGNARYFG